MTNITSKSAVPHLKAVAAWTQYPSKKKLESWKAYRVRKPVQPSSASAKMKHMAATCQACAGK